MTKALTQGAVDAIAVLKPFYNQAQKTLLENGISFYSEIASVMFLVAAPQTYIQDNPKTIENILRGLEKSVRFTEQHKEEVNKIVANAIKVDASMLQEMTAEYTFEISLDQSLIKSLEDEARWAILVP